MIILNAIRWHDWRNAYASGAVSGKNPPEKMFLNAVEREPVPTRVLNPNASSSKQRRSKQGSYRKMKLNFLNISIYFFFRGDFVGGILSGNRRLDTSGRDWKHFNEVLSS